MRNYICECGAAFALPDTTVVAVCPVCGGIRCQQVGASWDMLPTVQTPPAYKREARA
jgi:predicted  nucleic acid-binding Zn-ribbon protein